MCHRLNPPDPIVTFSVSSQNCMPGGRERSEVQPARIRSRREVNWVMPGGRAASLVHALTLILIKAGSLPSPFGRLEKEEQEYTVKYCGNKKSVSGFSQGGVPIVRTGSG